MLLLIFFPFNLRLALTKNHNHLNVPHFFESFFMQLIIGVITGNSMFPGIINSVNPYLSPRLKCWEHVSHLIQHFFIGDIVKVQDSARS